MSSHFARASESARRAARRSGGTVWTTPVASLAGMGILYTGVDERVVSRISKAAGWEAPGTGSQALIAPIAMQP
ncbi:MAG TPA: hypothetical protein VGS41_18350, partial [Chthonomonadales bacterium]|nr:hypothetical protein [Chthonomonadales bacterium]